MLAIRDLLTACFAQVPENVPSGLKWGKSTSDRNIFSGNWDLRCTYRTWLSQQSTFSQVVNDLLMPGCLRCSQPMSKYVKQIYYNINVKWVPHVLFHPQTGYIILDLSSLSHFVERQQSWLTLGKGCHSKASTSAPPWPGLLILGIITHRQISFSEIQFSPLWKLECPPSRTGVFPHELFNVR